MWQVAEHGDVTATRRPAAQHPGQECPQGEDLHYCPHLLQVSVKVTVMSTGLLQVSAKVTVMSTGLLQVSVKVTVHSVLSTGSYICHWNKLDIPFILTLTNCLCHGDSASPSMTTQGSSELREDILAVIKFWHNVHSEGSTCVLETSLSWVRHQGLTAVEWFYLF